MTSSTATLATRIVAGAGSGALAIAGLVWLAKLADNDSLARGLSAGGSVGIAIVIVLLVLSRRSQAPAEARLVGGRGDERERRIGTRALALSAAAMYATAVVCTMLGAFIEIAVEAALASVMIAGLVVAVAAYAIGVRRD